VNILIADQVEKICTDVLERAGFIVVNKPGLTEPELLALIPEYHGLIVRSGMKVTKEAIVAGKELKIIGRAGAGVDNIDTDAATRQGVIVMNTPGGNTVSAAEHTLSMMLSLARNIPQAHDSMKQGKWERKKYVGTELHGKTLGILGLGKIGREVALRCQAFGMTVVGFDPLLASEVAAKMNIELASMTDVLRRADFISIHTPLTAETHHMVSDREFRMCKKGARLVNCARGGIVDEPALLRALESETIAGAALDVFEHEPPTDSTLLMHPRVIATPHLGASTEDAQERVAQQIAQQVVDYFSGRSIVGAVNAEIVQLAMKKELRPFVQLAEKLGKLQACFLTGQLRKITVEVRGPMLREASELLSAATLKGMLGHVLAEPVNLVNARIIAGELGLNVEERREVEDLNYAHVLSVVAESETTTLRIGGTVFSDQHLRLTEIDGYSIEINPEGFLLMYKNVDRPGILAKVAATLASSGMNVASVALGRNNPGETALALFTLDSPLPDFAKRAIGEIEGIQEVRTAQF
jgi:D-3-phosphoglycerate dehydrogenase